MSDYWSNYWQQGHLTSFGQDLKYNYEGALASFWLEQFKQIGASSPTIVDIGTGNGALLELACRTDTVEQWQLIGVDSASLHVPEILNKSNIQFLANTKAEQIPLATASVDYVISQFGLEYSDLVLSVPELARIIKPGGRLTAIMHDVSSCIVQPNMKILEVTERLLVDNSPLKPLKALIESMADHPQPTAEALTVKAKLDTALQPYMLNDPVFQEALKGTNFPLFLNSVMHPKYTFAQRITMLAQFEQELIALQARLAELCHAARTPVQQQQLLERLKASGFSQLESNPVREFDGRLIGWYVGGVRD